MKTIYIISVIALLVVVPTTHGHLDELFIGLGNVLREIKQNIGLTLMGSNRYRNNGYPYNSYNDINMLQQENQYLKQKYEAMVHRDRRLDAEQIHVHNNNYMVMNPNNYDPDRTAAGLDLRML
ncbi:hypothetical protein RR48_12624 [Papilio machaon]|uniref:Uncharacterized protein n=1 Tax=Papilio machaon TaxID=76193 RepID=A0A194RMQ7_PAPMA|nr:hypothetical protein RR48_12624 [Papilio machaon]